MTLVRKILVFSPSQSQTVAANLAATVDQHLHQPQYVANVGAKCHKRCGCQFDCQYIEGCAMLTFLQASPGCTFIAQEITGTCHQFTQDAMRASVNRVTSTSNCLNISLFLF